MHIEIFTAREPQKYSNNFKLEALKVTTEIGLKKTSDLLEIPTHTKMGYFIQTSQGVSVFWEKVFTQAESDIHV